MDAKDKALEYFNEKGTNCSQAVLAAYGSELGFDEPSCLRVAACFGAGIGRLGLTCGAVTGACMVLGLRHGAEMAEGQAGRDKVYGRVQEFMRQFRNRFGSTDCVVLTACDLTTPEGRKAFSDRELHKTLCARLVAGAVEILNSDG